VSVNGTLVEDEMRRINGVCAHFRFNKCPIYTHDGASAKYSTNSHKRITVRLLKMAPRSAVRGACWQQTMRIESLKICFGNMNNGI
jgi:hypothetical protein